MGDNYWIRRPIGRRKMLGRAGTGAIGLAGLATVGCGRAKPTIDRTGGPSSPTAAPGTAAPTPAAPRYGDSPFGFHPAGPPYDEAARIGIRWTRGGGSPYLFWSLVDPDRSGDPAKFQWKGATQGPTGQTAPFDYDALFSVDNSGLNLLQNVDVQPSSSGEHRRPGSWLPVDEAAYRAFIKEAVKRYSFARCWQVANEPNLGPSRKLTGFADLQRITYEGIKEADPQAQVLMGGVAGNMGQRDMNDTYFESILKALAGKHMDVFDVHFYGDAKGGTLVSGDEQQRLLGYRDFSTVHGYFRKLLDSSGFSRVPIWVTEMGTFSGAVKLGPSTLTQTEADQARDLLKRWVYPLFLGVQKVFWAFGLAEGFGKWDDDFFDHTGLIYAGQDRAHRPGDKKLAYYTHKLMAEKLEGSSWSEIEAVREDVASKTYVYKFRRSGKLTHVAWWDYFNDATYAPGKTRQVPIAGLRNDTVLVTEAVPRFSTGAEVTDYGTAFRKDTRNLTNGTTVLALGENPVFCEEI